MEGNGANGAGDRFAMRVFICEDNPLVTLMLEDLVLDLGHDLVGTAETMILNSPANPSGGVSSSVAVDPLSTMLMPT